MLLDVDFDEYRALLLKTVSSNTFQQIFPLFVLISVPLVVLFFAKSGPNLNILFSTILMVFESFSAILPWNWTSGSSGNTPSQSVRSNRERQKNKKRHAASTNDTARVGGYYPGLVNISGTYCFMNSTIQAMASLSYLQPHIEAIHARAEELDVPTPVIDALRDLFHRLNTPHSRPSSIRPVDIISVLSSRSESNGLNSLFSSREHQDAQELFQLLTECIKSEITSIDKESVRDRGLSGLSQSIEANREIGKSVFDGLTANRRSCVVCGYTEAVMHFAFDNWQLAVPRMESACLLDDCLSEYTRLEVLRDCICRRCSVLATLHRLREEVKALAAVENLSASKKKRLKELKKMEARVQAALDDGRIEDDLKDVQMEKVFSAMSTKQAMIARPPPVLVLHINRSMHFTHYAAKNNIRIVFPEVLDLTPWTTSGNLSTTPTASLSTPSPIPKRSSTPTQDSRKEMASRTIYRLSAVVCHYGQHSFGHYICFRRKPPKKSRDGNESESNRWRPPRLVTESHPAPSSTITSSRINGANSNLGGVVDPDAVRIKKEIEEAELDGFEEYVWEDADPETAPGTGRGWLRISDDSVKECGIESVLSEGSGAFMLYYEKAIISTASPQSHSQATTMVSSVVGSNPYPEAAAAGYGVRSYGVGGGYGVGSRTPLSSEETLKPEMTMTGMVNGNGSLVSLSSGNGHADASSVIGLEGDKRFGSPSGSMSSSPVPVPMLGPRVVRNVAAGRGRRSQSLAPSLDGVERASSVSSPDTRPGMLSSSSASLDSVPRLSQSFPPPSSSKLINIPAASTSNEGSIVDGNSDISASPPLPTWSSMTSSLMSLSNSSVSSISSVTSSNVSSSHPTSGSNPTTPRKSHKKRNKNKPNGVGHGHPPPKSSPTPAPVVGLKA